MTVGIFLLAGSVLLLEIALTRVFAIMLWHHLAYMVVAVAMLGFGASGSLLTLGQAHRGEGIPARALALLAAGYGLAVIAALFVATQISVDTMALFRERANLVSLGLLYGVVLVPFLLAGAGIGLALSRLAAHVNRLYFFDLLGSAFGGAASVWLLHRVGSGATVVIAGAVGVLAGLAFACAGTRRLRLALLPPLAAAGFVAAAATGGVPWLAIPEIRIDVPYAPGKEKANAQGPSLRLYSATAEVEVGPSEQRVAAAGGNFGRADPRSTVGRGAAQDGTAPTLLYENASDLDAFPFLDDSQIGSPYVALEARGGRSPRVLVIGVGGGIDVMIALRHGAGAVTAVEINRAMIEMVTDRFDAYIGGLFRPGAHPLADRIELVHGEGRSFVRQRSDRWDVIQLSGVDSFTALSTGAYTLSESYLYTVEAIRDFYARLTPDGYLSYSRFIMPGQPRETLRLALIAREALAELGVEDPASQILVFRGFNWASTLVKRGPFTRPEVEALRDFARREDFWGLIFDPLHAAGKAFGSSGSLNSFTRKRLEDELGKGSIPGLGPDAETVERLSGAVRMLRDGRPEGAAPNTPELDRLLERVAAEAANLEGPFRRDRKAFTRLLRASDAERRRFLDGYEYDLTPSRDDSPFFFNYYRYRKLLDGTESAAWKSPYHPGFPVGHAVLLASLVQITALAALFILLPLRAIPSGHTAAGARGRVFAYFAALGAGFMFVEIALMQKLTLFLGHPIYSVTVVLTSLLGFAGLGSLWSARLGVPGPRVFRALVFVVPPVILAEALAAEFLLPGLLGLRFGTRVALVVLGLAPLGASLGLLFPLGIRLLHERAPELVPWAWGINAFLSVFSSIFCIVLAMATGFSLVFVLAAAIYAGGLLALASFASSASAAP